MKLKSLFKTPAAKKVQEDLKANVSALFKSTAESVSSAAMNTPAGSVLQNAAVNTGLSMYTPHLMAAVLLLLVAGMWLAKRK